MPAVPQCDLIVIGASAGGVHALLGIFRDMPQDLMAAVLVVLHIAEGGDSNLANILSRVTKLPIANAVDHDRLEHGRAYIAIADNQLTIEKDVIRVLPTAKEGRYRPCIDALFRSAAEAYGSRVAGILLSGMLQDGTEGLRHISTAGGTTIVQDPQEAGYTGMPENAIIGGHVQYVLPVADIARLIEKMATAREGGKGHDDSRSWSKDRR
jgi:two-component system, chemotaxis family, protein-glutamate methylesterase/glutaminase